MAWASVGSAGTTIGNTSADQTSLTFSVGAAGIASGIVAVAFVVVQNDASTNGDEGAVTGISDTSSNTWIKAREFCNSNESPQAGVTVSIWYSRIATALSSGDTIVAAFSAPTSRDVTIMGCLRFSIDSDYSVSIHNSSDREDDDTTNDGPISFSFPQRQFLHVRATGGFHPISHFATGSPSSGWTEDIDGFFGSTPDYRLYVEHHITNTSTTQTSDPNVRTFLGFSGAHYASAYIMFQEAPPISSWHRKLHEPPPPRLSVPENSQQYHIYEGDKTSIDKEAAVPASFKGWFKPLSEPVRFPPRLETGSQQFILPPNKPIIRRTIAVVGSHDGNPQLHGVHYPTSQIATKVHS